MGCTYAERAQLKADAEKQLANERTRAQEAAATNRAGPTNVSGRPAAVANFRSVHEAELAHVAGQIPNAEMVRIRELNRQHPDQMPYI